MFTEPKFNLIFNRMFIMVMAWFIFVAHVMTESRNVIEYDIFVIEPWMKEPAPTAMHHKRKVRRKRSWMDEVHADLGMTRVRGAVSGKVYYE